MEEETIIEAPVAEVSEASVEEVVETPTTDETAPAEATAAE